MHHHHQREQQAGHCCGRKHGHEHHKHGEQHGHCRHGGSHAAHDHEQGTGDFRLAGCGGGRGHRRHGMGGRDDHFDRHGFGGSRRLGSEDLQLIVLTLLEQQPRHGYDIIKALEAHSLGFYAPSPGMVYPILTFLEESDQATVSAAGNKKLYTITDTGRAALDANRERADAILERLQQAGQQMQQMQQMYAEETAGAGDVLHETVHALRAVLRDKRAASAEEKQRIAEVLQQALKEIQ